MSDDITRLDIFERCFREELALVLWRFFQLRYRDGERINGPQLTEENRRLVDEILILCDGFEPLLNKRETANVLARARIVQSRCLSYEITSSSAKDVLAVITEATERARALYCERYEN